MKYLVTASEMKKYDQNTINIIGIPSLVLMERAALFASEKIDLICGEYKLGKNLLIVCGTGNNGGDGLALARLLFHKGYRADVLIVGEPGKASDSFLTQLNIVRKLNINLIDDLDTNKSYDIVVDAIFGVGLSRKIEGMYENVINTLNELPARKIALDIPSGINADDGRVMGCAFKADDTITFAYEKLGHYLYPGCDYCGLVHLGDIGINNYSFFECEPQHYYYDESIAELLPDRSNNSNKGSFGKVLSISGSVNMAGAAILSAEAAYKSGAGMVKILSPEENRIIIQERLPEALYGNYSAVSKALEWASVILIGPGLGRSGEAEYVLEYVLENSDKPLVIDADAINLISEHSELKSLLKGERDIVITPHIGELSRFLNREIDYIKNNMERLAKELISEYPFTLVAKDANTLVFKNNLKTYVNFYGNSGLATAGSGDVLAGIIAGLMAQGLEGYEAACKGVAIHAKAGDKCAEKIGQHALMAGNIHECI